MILKDIITFLKFKDFKEGQNLDSQRTLAKALSSCSKLGPTKDLSYRKSTANFLGTTSALRSPLATKSFRHFGRLSCTYKTCTHLPPNALGNAKYTSNFFEK